MTIVTMTERSMMIKGVKDGAVHFEFCYHQAQCFKNTVDPAPALDRQVR